MMDYKITTPLPPFGGAFRALDRHDVYVATHNGTRYQLRIIKLVKFNWGDEPRYNGHVASIFQAKCWWTDNDGENWWIGAALSTQRESFGDLVGPFNDPDEALVYLKLAGNESPGGT